MFFCGHSDSCRPPSVSLLRRGINCLFEHRHVFFASTDKEIQRAIGNEDWRTQGELVTGDAADKDRPFDGSLRLSLVCRRRRP